MKEFVLKHKKICIIVGVILALILVLLIYGLIMAGKNRLRVKYAWNGKEQYIGELCKDTPMHAKVYITEDGDLRLDFYGQGAGLSLVCNESIFTQKTYVDFDRSSEEDSYQDSMLISYHEALYQAQSELVTEGIQDEEEAVATEITEEDVSSEVENSTEDVSNIVVPLVNEEDADEMKETSYEASRDAKFFAEISKEAFGISLPHHVVFSLVSSGYGLGYVFDVVLDQLGNINVASLGDKEVPVSFDDVENYDKVSKAYPDFVLPQGIVIEEAYDDYTVDDNAEFVFDSMIYMAKDAKRDQYVDILFTELSNKEKLVGYLSQFATKTTVDISGVPVDIYADDSGSLELAVYNDSKSVYCIYGYDKGILKEALVDFIPAATEKK